jgi:outer membrane receptor protein involved in Fe transport
VKKTLLATSVAAFAAVSQLSYAQMLEEVIVTAEKRETSIQDTPIAVSAFSQDDLDAQLINDQMNMQFNVPSLVMTKGNFTSADVRIRGVGSGAIAPTSGRAECSKASITIQNESRFCVVRRELCMAGIPPAVQST